VLVLGGDCGLGSRPRELGLTDGLEGDEVGRVGKMFTGGRGQIGFRKGSGL
jgi:hypothetical protein